MKKSGGQRKPHRSTTGNRPLAITAMIVVAALVLFFLYAEARGSRTGPSLGSVASVRDGNIKDPPGGPKEQLTSTSGPSLGRVAFVRDGSIWVKDLPDGQERQLTHGGNDHSPLWSPSGNWLTFERGTPGIQWVTRSDGTDAKLVTNDDGGAAWSPTADLLARRGSGLLTIIEPTQVTTTKIALPGGPGGVAWSPDGRSIAFSHRSDDRHITISVIAVPKSGEASNPTPTVWYTSPGPSEIWSLGWSGDGQCLIFQENPSFSASRAAGGLTLEFVCHPGAFPTAAGAALTYPGSFAQAAGSALVAIGGNGRPAWDGIPLAVRDIGTATTTTVGDSNWATTSPAWSPDGASVAFVFMAQLHDVAGGNKAHEGLMQRKIAIADRASGFQTTQITDDPKYRDERPLWSHDGSDLLIVRFDEENHASLWLVARAGGSPRLVISDLDTAPLQPMEPSSAWFGFYGNLQWDQVYDWWPGPSLVHVP